MRMIIHLCYHTLLFMCVCVCVCVCHTRWFDKSFQIIVCRNAMSAINFEHAWGDGVAVLRLFNELFKETTTRPVLPHEPSSSPLPEKLQPVLSDNLKAAIGKAKREVEMRTQSLSTSTLQYGRFGKSLLKTKSLSPDGVMQLAFQVSLQPAD